MNELDFKTRSDNKFYSDLIDKYKDLAYSIALKITRNEQDSEEIVQDSFIKVFQGVSQFKKESQFSTWFYRIVYNTSISAVRNKKIQISDIDIEYIDKSHFNGINDEIQNLNAQDRKQIIQTSMNTLNELDYTILMLYYFENKSLKEIALITEKKKNYLKVLLQRARIKLYNGLNHSIKCELKELI